jgi:hypothetical protein
LAEEAGHFDPDQELGMTKIIFAAMLASCAFGQTTTEPEYASQERKPLVPISPTNPLYTGCHFRDDDPVHMRLSYTTNAAANFVDVNSQGSFSVPGGSLRDTSCMYVPNEEYPLLNGTFYFLATPSSGVGIQFFSSTDLVNFSGITTINMAHYAPGAVTAWAPEWWHDPNSGNYYFWVAVGMVPYSYNTAKTPYLVQFNPATASVVGTPKPVVLNGTTQRNTFDYFPYYSDGTYYLVYVDQQNNPVVTQPIAYAMATSVGGPYTQQTVDGLDYFRLGTFRTEAPTLIRLGQTGCVRIVFDTWIVPASGGRKYSPVYRDSCVSAGALFSQGSLINGPSPLLIGAYEHGTLMSLTDTLSSSVVFKAAGTADVR